MFFPKKLLVKAGGACAVMTAVNFCYAEGQVNQVEFFGSASMQSGQMVNYKFLTTGYELTHQWLQDYMMAFGFRARLNPRVQGVMGANGWLLYNAYPDSLLQDPGRDVRSASIVYGIERAEMIVNCSPDPTDSLCSVHAGLFPFKYNREVRNLGEYLFRTGCYPGYIISDGFDRAGVQLGGIRVTNDLFNCWHNELFLTSELYLYPLNDFSLTYLTDFTPFQNRMLNFGAAVQMFRYFSINNDYTTPKYYLTTVAVPGSTPTAPSYYFSKDDPLHTDTLFYTFAGTKIMARFTFDPKPLMEGISIFGPEDLKLYSEAIILGVKNYPANPDPDYNWAGMPVNEFGYDKLIEKMPIMLGLNLPAFKILDVFSVEAEYYGKKYANRVPVITQKLSMMTLPVPYDPNVNGGYPSGDSLSSGLGTYSKDTYRSGAAQWKWSVYLKKSLFGNMNITVQAARDHMRVPTTVVRNIDQEEALIKDKQWYWMLKFGYSF